MLNSPNGVAVDGAGNLYIADTQNHRIRMVDTNGIITTVAGIGGGGAIVDGGPATASYVAADDVALDAAGNLYIAGGDLIAGSGLIRMVSVVRQ
jgi:sugar lactone lactonase YvrE